MALTRAHLMLFDMLRKKGVIGNGATSWMVEFGEQNWFGDISYKVLQSLIQDHHGDTDRAKELNQAFGELLTRKQDDKFKFDVAKLYYDIIFDVKEYVAIDFHGTEASIALDLNAPLDIEEQFQVATNLGTSEHVFNQYQFFKSVHDLTAPAGFMIHAIPNQGGWDHGFYNYHPTFIFDLVSVNEYHIITVILTGMENDLFHSITREEYVKLAVDGKLPVHSGLIAVLQKPDMEAPFRVPMQGYYGGTLPPDLADAWKKLPK